MIDLYSKATSNGRKVSVMLEETGLEYRVHPIDLAKKEQKTPEFLKMNPNGRIPVIIDQDGPGGAPVTIFESAAILIYLAQKSGMFLPEDRAQATKVVQWLMFQVAHVTPMSMQVMWLTREAERGNPAPNIEVFRAETARIYGILDGRLEQSTYLADDYSIADIATYPWILRHDYLGLGFGDTPHLARWFDEISKRPAVISGLNIPPRDDGM